MFLRKSNIRRDPLPITMNGVRMGERLLQIGVDDPAIAGMLAAKVGLSGSAAMAVPDERAAGRARDGIANAGGLVDLHVIEPGAPLPFGDSGFDALVVHNMDHQLGALAED